jgi:hypothetical protein
MSHKYALGAPSSGLLPFGLPLTSIFTLTMTKSKDQVAKFVSIVGFILFLRESTYIT